MEQIKEIYICLFCKYFLPSDTRMPYFVAYIESNDSKRCMSKYDTSSGGKVSITGNLLTMSNYK